MSRAAVLIVVGLSLLISSSPVAAQVLIPVANRRDHVFDDTRNILYISTTSGTIERYDVATNTLLTPFTAGGVALNGIDISLDDQFVYVADSGQYGTQDVIRKFNTSTGILSNLFFDRRINVSSSEGEAWDIVVTNAGHALVTTNFNGSGYVAPRKIDLATDTFSFAFPGPGMIPELSHLHRSNSGNLVFILYSNSTPAVLTIYDPATQKSYWRGELTSDNTNRLGAVNRNGTMYAYDGNLTGRVTLQKWRGTGGPETLSGLHGGIGFSPVYDVFYGVDIVSDQVVAYETNTLTEIARYSIGENVIDARPFANGIMSFSGDGRFLFLSTPSGIRMLNVALVPEPSSLMLLMAAGMILAGWRFRT